MKGVRFLLILGVAGFGLSYLVFRSSFHPLAPNSPAPEAANPVNDLVIGEPIHFQNLTIFPVSSKRPRTSDRFITLDEGLAAGTVEIFERSAAPIADQQPPASNSPGRDPFAPSERATPTPTANRDPFAPENQPTENTDPFSAPNPPVATGDPFAAPRIKLHLLRLRSRA